MIEHSPSIKELAAALAKAEREIKAAVKDSANPYFKSRYADLASVWEACREPLTKHGLAVCQWPSADGPRVTVVTLLTHDSGEWVRASLTMTAKEDSPQAIGSVITYARRYALAAAVGVAPDDDDAEAAEGRKNGDRPSAPAKSTTRPATATARSEKAPTDGDLVAQAKTLMRDAQTIERLNDIADRALKSDKFTDAQKRDLSACFKERADRLADEIAAFSGSAAADEKSNFGTA